MAIYQKLLKFQQLGITIKKDATNPHFRSSYSSLNEVLDKVKGPLNEAGIIIIQRPEVEWSVGQQVQGLVTELIDTEDDSLARSFVPFVGATDMQKLGGAITYARRYSLVALLGLEDEDDDGNTASAAKAAPAPVQRPTRVPVGPVARNDQPFEGDIPNINLD